MRQRFLFSSLFAAFLVFSANALMAQHQIPGIDRADDSRPKDEDQSLSETMARNNIKREEAAHHENIERARELARLGAQIRDAFQNAKTLGSNELKKIERMEKLTRKIRSAAGGTGDDDPEAEPPPDTTESVERLAKLSDELREQVEKTPRQVISASIIERANAILQLLEHIRKSSR